MSNTQFNIKIFHSSQAWKDPNNWASLAGHLRHLISTLTKKTYRAHVAEITQLESMCDTDLVTQVVLKCLVNHIEWKDVKQKDQYRVQYLSQRIGQICTQANFASLISQAFGDFTTFTDGFLSLFSKTLKLGTVQQVTVALALVQSITPVLKDLGSSFLKETLPGLASTMASTKNDEKFTDYVSQELLLYIQSIDLPEKETLIESLRKGSNLTQLPAVLSNPERSDVKRNFKRENRLKQAPYYLQELEKSFSPAELLSDLGFVATSSTANLKKVLSQFTLPFSAASIAEVIGMMVDPSRTEGDPEQVLMYTESGESMDLTPATSWNPENFASVVTELCPDISWLMVLEHLDYPEFRLYDVAGLKLIVDLCKKVFPTGFSLSDTILRKWKNTEGQLSFIFVAISAPPEIFSFPPSPELSDFVEAQQINTAGSPMTRSFLSLPLVSTLLWLSQENTACHGKIHELFQHGVKQCPKALLLGISLISQPYPLKKELTDELLQLFLPATGHPHSMSVLSHLWTVDSYSLIEAMVHMYDESPASLSRILDVAQELKGLKAILDYNPLSNFSIDLASLASSRDHLNLVRWLEDMIEQYGNDFCKMAISFLRERIVYQQQHQQQQQATPEETRPQQFVLLTYDTVHTFLEQFRSIAGNLSQEVKVELNQLVGLLESEAFPSDIEKEANAIFSRIYDGDICMSDIIILLQAFQSSSDPRERKIFQCMIRSLYEEYPHIPKYPEKELHITGVLFGSLIQYQLVSYIPLVVALRYILEALKQPPNSKLFKFGLYALEQFMTRLHEWPQYCSHLRQIPQLQSFRPQLYHHIEAILAQLPPQYSVGQVPGVFSGANGPSALGEQASFSGEHSDHQEPGYEYRGEAAYARGYRHSDQELPQYSEAEHQQMLQMHLHQQQQQQLQQQQQQQQQQFPSSQLNSYSGYNDETSAQIYQQRNARTNKKQWGKSRKY
eukprot:TRINITY_DN2203_c0_g2_i2.p1 TRINITY_DN2203_c0_g2~~TRINITY_DN2203_c0_g2_i2.p1  ORF type:complete len:967 (+),score=168.54 TRINITY_DN2203_c0_g2_i2:30-2903(+)